MPVRAIKERPTRLFPTRSPGSLNIRAFQPLNWFQDPLAQTDLGSQAKFVRDSTGTWYLLAYRGDAGWGKAEHSDDYIDVYRVAFGSRFQLLEKAESVHIYLPPGDTSFNSTGTHHVDRSGKLLVSSSYRGAENRGNGVYGSRVDECAGEW
jgi:hypothetical protein